jgi:anti-sigma factor RsiW
MSCDRARRLFGACWDDELTHAEREWLEGHLAACPGCRGEYDAFTRSLELVGSLPRAEAPPDLAERVLARSRRAAPAPDALGERPARWAPAMAAAAAVVVLALAVMLALPGAPWRGPAGGGTSQVAVVSGGPAVPVLVSGEGREPARPEGRTGGAAPGVAADDPFDHGADVEFILDPVSVTRGRATVARAGARQPDAEGERAIISF